MRIRVEYDDEEIATHASIDEAEKDILEMNAAGVMPLRVYAIDENGDEIEGQALGCDWNVKITSLGKSSLPRIDLCFTGWLRGVPVQRATVVATGETISVTGMSSKELAKKLEKGKLAISLGEALDDARKSEVELFDYYDYSESLD